MLLRGVIFGVARMLRAHVSAQLRELAITARANAVRYARFYPVAIVLESTRALFLRDRFFLRLVTLLACPIQRRL